MRNRAIWAAASLMAAVLGAAPAEAETTIRAVMQTPDFGHMVYETLYALDEAGEPQPQMVATHEVSDDELTHRFTLRDGLAFHDGTSVTGEDVAASLQRWMESDALGKQLARIVEAIEPTGDKTFEVRLSEPTGLLPAAFAKPANDAPYIMPAEAANADEGADREFIGSGPFVFDAEAWRPGSRIVFEKNETYVPRDEPASGMAGGRDVKVDRVEWITMPDPQQQVNALLNGEIDYVQMPLIDLFPLIEPDPNVKLVTTNELGRQLVFRFNWLTEPFDDPKIREAAWYALNQEDFLKGIIGNEAYYQVCRSIFACDTPWMTETGMEGRLQSNYERSKQLLQEAGYDGTPVVIPQFTGLGSNVGPIAKTLLERGGFTVDLQYMEGEAWDARIASKAPVEEGGWSAVVRSQDVLSMLNPLDIPMLDASCETAQPGWPCDEEIERLRTEFLKAKTRERQQEVVEALQRRALEVSPYVPLGQYHVPLGVRTSLEGIPNAVVPVFWNIEKTSE